MKNLRVDRSFLIIVAALVLFGFFIFTSASMGLLAQDSDGVKFNSIAFNQIFFGLVLGLIALFGASKIHYRNWRRYAFYFFIFSILLNILVFIPFLSLEHGGARRWLLIGNFSFQPSEVLKIGYLIYLATWLSGVREKVATFKFGLLPFMIITGICGILLLLQPDTDTFIVMAIAGTAMLLSAGARWRDVLILVLIGAIALTILIFTRPYVKQRVMTFLNPSSNPQSSGYQIQQSLIAIGSGGIGGKGFGQSVQKFGFLPEPYGDSIFAVASEEFGFIGAVILIALYCAFGVKGLRIANRAPDVFGGLLVIGIVILIVTQSFINMAAMLGVLPLSGLPLIFVSQGGTALLFALAEVGIVLNVSKYQKRFSA